MTDIATIGTALGSIKTAIGIAKLIKDSGSTLEQAEVKLQIADLIGSLADAKIELADIQTHLLEKDRVIEELNALINTKKSVVWEKPYYWTIDGDDKDGPYCQQCYDKDQKLIRLQGGGKNAWRCQTCKSRVIDSNYTRPKRQVTTIASF